MGEEELQTSLASDLAVKLLRADRYVEQIEALSVKDRTAMLQVLHPVIPKMRRVDAIVQNFPDGRTCVDRKNRYPLRARSDNRDARKFTGPLSFGYPNSV